MRSAIRRLAVLFSPLAILCLDASAPPSLAADTKAKSTATDVCTVLADAVQDPTHRSYKRLAAGVDIAETQKSFSRRRGYVGLGDKDRERLEISRVDIDGDGIRDFRITENHAG